MTRHPSRRTQSARTKAANSNTTINAESRFIFPVPGERRSEHDVVPFIQNAQCRFKNKIYHKSELNYTEF